jgi:hypothetical protein
MIRVIDYQRTGDAIGDSPWPKPFSKAMAYTIDTRSVWVRCEKQFETINIYGCDYLKEVRVFADSVESDRVVQLIYRR